MALNVGNITAALKLDTTHFTKALKDTQRALDNAFGKSAQRNVDATNNNLNKMTGHLKDVERIVGGIMVSQAFYGMALEIKNASAAMFEFMNNMEKAQVAMEYFLGSSDKADAFIYNMKDFAASTAFSTEQALELSKRLMGAGFKPGNVRPIMETLNDAANATGTTREEMDRIVLAMTQVVTQGKIMGQEIRQFANANIPIYQILREELNLAKEDLARIGDLNIPGEVAVAAILRGFEKRYAGAAERIANTMGGMIDTIRDDALILGESLFEYPYKQLEKFVRKIRDFMEEARDIVHRGGIGALFESMFSPGVQQNLRLVIAGLQSLGRSLGVLASTAGPAIAYIFDRLIAGFAFAIQPIAILARYIAYATQAAFQAVPALKYLLAAIISLTVASVVGRILLLLWKVTGIGLIANTVAAAVVNLTRAIRGLMLVITRNPVVMAVLALVAGLLWLASKAEFTRRIIAALHAQILKLAGIDVGEILQPDYSDQFNLDDLNLPFTDFDDQLEDIKDGLDGVGEGAENAGDKAEEAGKKMKDSFLASFDEVYQVPEKDDSGGKDDGGGGGGGNGGGGGIGDIGGGGSIYDNLPDLPGKIKLPEFEVPEIDWPPLPRWLTHTNIIKIEFPPLPPFGAEATAIEFAINQILEALKGLAGGFQPVADWLGQLPKQFQGAFSDILRTVGEFGINFPPAFVPRMKEGFDKSLEDAKNYGGALGGALGKSWDSLLDDVKGYGGAFGGAMGRVWDNALNDAKSWGAGLLYNMGKYFNETVSSVKSWGTEFGTGFMDAIKHIGEVWGERWQTVKEKISDSFKDMWDGAKNNDAVRALFGDLDVSLPAFIAGVLAAVGKMFSDLIPNLSGKMKDLPGALSKPFSGLSGSVSKVVSDVTAHVGKIPGNIKTKLTTVGTNLWTPFSKISGSVSKIPTNVRTYMGRIPGYIKSKLSGVGTRLWSPFSKISGSVSKIPNNIRTYMGRIPGYIKSRLSSVPSRLSSPFSGAGRFGSRAVDAMVKPFKSLPNKIKTSIASIPSKISEVLGKIKIPSFSTVGSKVKTTFSNLKSIAGFETGGIIDKDSIVRVGEKGKREAIVPLENKTAMAPFADAVAARILEENGSSGGSSGGSSQPVLHVGTLIADDRGLRELYRRFQVVSKDERMRGGLA